MKPRTYVGVCYDSGAWGGDLTGLLVVRVVDGWLMERGHISSDQGWAERDIRYHFDRRPDPSPDDTYEWAGLLTQEQIAERFGWVSEAAAP